VDDRINARNFNNFAWFVGIIACHIASLLGSSFHPASCVPVREDLYLGKLRM
jgi:hypothetical protein